MPHGKALLLALAVLLPPSSAHAWRAPGPSRAVAVDGADDVLAAGAQPDGYYFDLVVAKYAGASGTELWRTAFGGTDPISANEGATSVAVDAAGDVVAAGVLENVATDRDFAVVKVAKITGAQIWRVEIDGTASGAGESDTAFAVAVDGAGDVVAVGRLDNATTVFLVVKLDGDTGAELWRYSLTGGPSPAFALRVAVDGAGDVVAAGMVSNVATGDDFAVVKLAGATGAELWRYELAGPSSIYYDRATALALDPAGDVVAAGFLATVGGAPEFTVVKLDGSLGTETWRTAPAGGGCSSLSAASDVAVDASGNPVVVGYLPGTGLVCRFVFSAVKLDAATGAELWWYEAPDPDYSAAGSVAVNAAGDVVVGGGLAASPPSPPYASIATIVTLDGGTGDERWRQTPVVEDSGVYAVVLDSQGEIVTGVASTLDDTVLKLSKLDGTVGPVRGARFMVRDVAGDPSRRFLRAQLRDEAIAISPPGSAGDPTVSGAVLSLVNPTTLEAASFALPAASWRGTGTPPGARGYRYVDASGANGPCRRVFVKPDKLMAVCDARLGAFPFSLDEPTQGSLTVSLKIGTATAQCATFGGDVREDAGTSNPGPAGSFRAFEAPAAFGDCP